MALNELTRSRFDKFARGAFLLLMALAAFGFVVAFWLIFVGWAYLINDEGLFLILSVIAIFAPMIASIVAIASSYLGWYALAEDDRAKAVRLLLIGSASLILAFSYALTVL